MPMLAHLTAFYSAPSISLLFKKMYISDSLYLQSARCAGSILKLPMGIVMRNVILLKSHSLSKVENFLLFFFLDHSILLPNGVCLAFQRVGAGALSQVRAPEISPHWFTACQGTGLALAQENSDGFLKGANVFRCTAPLLMSEELCG